MTLQDAKAKELIADAPNPWPHWLTLVGEMMALFPQLQVAGVEDTG